MFTQIKAVRPIAFSMALSCAFILTSSISIAQDKPDDSPDTMLAEAMYMHDHDAVTKLLLQKPTLQKKFVDAGGGTIITLAAQKYFPEVLDYAITQGLNVNATDAKGCTALFYSAQKKDSKMLTALLKAGAEIDKKTPFGWTAAMAAMECGNFQATQILLTSGAQLTDVKFMYARVLARLCADGDVKGLERVLAKSGFDVNSYDAEGCLLLTYAIGPGNDVCTQTLLNAGAKLDKFDYGTNGTVKEYQKDHPSQVGGRPGYPPYPGRPD